MLAQHPILTASVLVVDDDNDLRDTLSTKCRIRGHKCVAVGTVAEAIDNLNLDINVCVLDLKLGQELWAGLKVLEEIRVRFPDILVIVLTGFREEVGNEMIRGATLIVPKPSELDLILFAIEALVHTRRRVVSAEVEFRRNLEALRGYVNAMAVGVVVLDGDGRVQSFNDTMVIRVGLTEKNKGDRLCDVIGGGNHFGELHLPPNERPPEFWDRHRRDSPPVEVVVGARTFHVFTRRVAPSEGPVETYVQNWIEITKRKRAIDLLGKLPELAKLPVRELATELVNGVKKMGYSRVYLYTWVVPDPADAAAGSFMCASAAGVADPDAARGEVLPKDDPYVAAAVVYKKALRLNRSELYELKAKAPSPGRRNLDRVREMVKVPLLLSDSEKIGMLCIELIDADGADDLDDEDLELMDLLSKGIADALSTSNQIPLHKARERWEGPTYAIDQALTTGGTLPDVLKVVVEQTARALRANFGWLLLKSEEEAQPGAGLFKREKPYWSDGTLPISAEVLENYVHPGKEGLIPRTLLRKKIDIVPDVWDDTDFLAYFDTIRANEAFAAPTRMLRSAVTIPVFRGTEAIGVLALYFTQPFEPTATDRGHLQSVATLIAVALQRMRQEQLLAARAAQAAKVADLYFLGAGVAHALRNPLTELRSTIDVALITPNRAAVDELLRTTKKTLKDLATRIEQMIKWVRPAGVAPSEVSLKDLVTELHGLLAERFEHTGVTFEFDADPDLPPAYGAPDGLKMAVVDLFMNAITALEGYDGEKRLTVTLRRCEINPCRLELRIADTGPGMPADQLDVFNRFETQDPPAGGVGLGLYLAYRFVTGAGGQIKIESAPGRRGTTLVLTLPCTGDP